MAEQSPVFGYLPHDRPPTGALISLAFQHFLTMFPATVLVAIITRFDISVTLFASGVATVVALILSGMRIPMYYGGSFSYLAAVGALMATLMGNGYSLEAARTVVQVGIIGTALLNVIVGVVIRWAGKEALDRVLPPVVTGSVAVVIGIALAKAALDMATGAVVGEGSPAVWRAAVANGSWFTTAMITLVATILFSVYLRGRGLLGMLPVLLGAIVGYLVALASGFVDFEPYRTAALITTPPFSFPAFGDANAWTAILAIAPIAIATIPESTAHLYQVSLYVDRLAEEMGRRTLQIKRLIGLNLMIDGVADSVNGFLGASAGTNYGENNSLMVITRNYSGPVLIGAGVVAILAAFVGKLAGLVLTMPPAVTGGLAVYLFGVIGLQGVALMMAEGVNFFDPKALAISAVILVVGIGGAAFPGGNIPMWGMQLPSIATAAVLGILINLVFVIFPTRAPRPEVVPAPTAE